MLLSQLLEKVEYNGTFEDFEISVLTCDSRNATEKDSVFVCIKGFSLDGHDFAAEVMKKGARAVVVEKDLGLKNQILVKNSREAYAKMCSAYFGYPSKKLKLIGVTGTNGKTTVTTVIITTQTTTEERIISSLPVWMAHREIITLLATITTADLTSLRDRVRQTTASLRWVHPALTVRQRLSVEMTESLRVRSLSSTITEVVWEWVWIRTISFSLLPERSSSPR